MSSTEPLVKALMDTIPQVGEVSGITIRPARRADPVPVEVAILNDKGIEGDHFGSNYSDKRAVTLIQQEHLEVVGSILGIGEAEHKKTRRNIAVRGINLLSLKGKKFCIGKTVLEGTGECFPCSRMEENFGPGGYNAMRGHGGLTARVLKGGEIRPGDKVRLL